MENPKLPKIFVIAIFSLVFIVMFGSSMFVTIEPGEKGVIFKRLMFFHQFLLQHPDIVFQLSLIHI